MELEIQKPNRGKTRPKELFISNELEKQNSKVTQAAVAKTNQIIKNSEGKVWTDLLKMIDEPVQISPKTVDKEDFNFETFVQESKAQIDNLTERIETIDKNQRETKQKMDHLNKVCNKMVDQRTLTKELIRENQETLFRTENNLDEINLKIPKSNAEIDKSMIVRKITNLFSFQKDEILLKVRIAKLESQIGQRNRLLQSINNELAEILVALDFETQISDNSNQILETLRTIRFEMMRNNRQLKQRVVEKELENSQVDIFESFFLNMKRGNEQVNSTLENLKNFVLEARNSAQEATLQFQKLQSDVILPKVGNPKLDQKVSQLIKNKR